MNQEDQSQKEIQQGTQLTAETTSEGAATSTSTSTSTTAVSTPKSAGTPSAAAISTLEPPTATSSPAVTAPFNPDTSPPSVLRSGKPYKPNRQVSLDKYINRVYERVRESEGFANSESNSITQELEKTYEKTLAQFHKIKEEARKLEKTLLEFQELSHSLTSSSESCESPPKSNNNISNGEEEHEVQYSLSPGEFLIEWLSVSLAESEKKNLTAANLTKSRMANVDITKVAKLTSQLVPIFSGGSSPTVGSELHTFLGCCKRVLECLTQEEKSIFLKIFPTRLRGQAYQLMAASQPTSFGDAEKLLIQNFLPRETYQEIVNSLIAIRQHPLESLTAFTARLKQLLTRCKEGAESKYGTEAATNVNKQLDDFAKEALKGGINDQQIRQYLLFLGDDTLDNLIIKAVDMERMQRSTQHLFPNYNDATLHSSSYPITPMDPFPHQDPPMDNNINNSNKNFGIDNGISMKTFPLNPYAVNFNPAIPGNPYNQQPQLDRQMGERKVKREPTPPKEINSILANITCRFCRKRGHTYSDCLTRKNTPFCSICQIYNHDARDCRRKRSTPNNNIADNSQPGYYARSANYINTANRPQPQQQNFNNRNNHNPNNNSNNYNRNFNNANNPNSNARVFNVNKECDFCGSKGHSESECQQKVKWESKQQGNVRRSSRKTPTRRNSK